MYSCAIVLVFLNIILRFVNGDDFYSFTVQDNTGKNVSLEQYRGKVTLVVNVASHCGYTETSYRALSKIHDILSFGGFFSVLAFPCNQFGDQEPDSAETVAELVTAEYGVEFPIFNKISVIGENAHPAFRNLIEQSSKEPEWNFYKYLVDADGTVINAWGTREEIEDIFPQAQEAVDEAKKQAKEGTGKSQETTAEEPEPIKEEL